MIFTLTQLHFNRRRLTTRLPPPLTSSSSSSFWENKKKSWRSSLWCFPFYTCGTTIGNCTSSHRVYMSCHSAHLMPVWGHERLVPYLSVDSCAHCITMSCAAGGVYCCCMWCSGETSRILPPVQFLSEPRYSLTSGDLFWLLLQLQHQLCLSLSSFNSENHQFSLSLAEEVGKAGKIALSIHQSQYILKSHRERIYTKKSEDGWTERLFPSIFLESDTRSVVICSVEIFRSFEAKSASESRIQKERSGGAHQTRWLASIPVQNLTWAFFIILLMIPLLPESPVLSFSFTHYSSSRSSRSSIPCIHPSIINIISVHLLLYFILCWTQDLFSAAAASSKGIGTNAAASPLVWVYATS